MSPQHPSHFEFTQFMKIFDKKGIKDLPIFPVRGNHDCKYADDETELNLREQYPNWQMDHFYYEKEFDLGNGEKFSLLNVDSCLLLCETVSRNPEKYYPSLDDDSREIYGACDPDRTSEANKMMEWLNSTMTRTGQDP